jgi:hypothetical protein
VNSSYVPTLERGRFIEIIEFLIVLRVLQKYNGFWLFVSLHKNASFGQIMNLRVSPVHCANVALNSHLSARGGAAGALVGEARGLAGAVIGGGCLP